MFCCKRDANSVFVGALLKETCRVCIPKAEVVEREYEMASAAQRSAQSTPGVWTVRRDLCLSIPCLEEFL